MNKYIVYMPDKEREVMADRWEIDNFSVLTFFKNENYTVAVFNMKKILGFWEKQKDLQNL